MDVKIFVASHKPYRMPTGGMYVPLGVGAMGGKPCYEVTDATGDSITEKNPLYCELSGLYWIWKNVNADYMGLAHYRRHFAGRSLSRDKWRRVITQPELERALARADVVLPKPRRYFIETNWSQYAHAHGERDLVIARQCVEELCPDYLPAFDAVMRRTGGHRFNMLVMKRDALDSYCGWLFPLLEALEARLNADGGCKPRVIGFVSERLLDVWIEKNRTAYVELPVVNMESQHWIRKAYNFLKRKLSAQAS